MKFIKRVGKRVNDLMNEKLTTYKEILTDSKNRKIIGIIIMGIGFGLGGSLYISGYIN